MSEPPLLAASYALCLAGAAAFLSRTRTRTSRPRVGTAETDWARARVASFRAGIACTLLVLAGFVLIVAAARYRNDAGALAWLAAAAIALGGFAATTWSSLRRRGSSRPSRETSVSSGTRPASSR